MNGDERRSVPLLILDLDGTVRHGKAELGRFVNGPDDVVIFPRALDAMREWRRIGGRIVGVTNQGGIELGHVEEHAVAAAIDRTVELTEGMIDAVAYCPHFGGHCWCRKPRPGMVYQALHALSLVCPDERYPPDMAMVVGDRPEDVGLAVALDVRFMSAEDWRGDGEAKAL